MEKGNGELVIEFDSREDAMVLYYSLEPEISQEKSDRSRESMKIDENAVTIQIISRDGPSFRASLSSIMRWIKVSTGLMEL